MSRHNDVQVRKTVQRVCGLRDTIRILSLVPIQGGQAAGRFDFGVHEAEIGNGILARVRGVLELARIPLRGSPVDLGPVEAELLAGRVSRDYDPTLDSPDGRVG